MSDNQTYHSLGSMIKVYGKLMNWKSVTAKLKLHNTGGSHSTSQTIQVFWNGMTCKALNGYGHSTRAYKSQWTF